MNQLNTLNDDEKNDTPREWNILPPAINVKSRTSPPKTSPVVSAIMGRLNYHYVDNDNAGVYPSEYPFEYTSSFVPYPGNTLIKLIDDNEIDQLLEFFHSEHDDNLLDFNIQMLQP